MSSKLEVWAVLSTSLLLLASLSDFSINAENKREYPGIRMCRASEREPFDVGVTRSVDVPPQMSSAVARVTGFIPEPEDSFIGYRVGCTWYDCQHIGSMGRQIARGSDGRIHFSWTYQGDGTPGTPEHFVWYNSAVYDGNAWTLSLGANGTVISGIRASYTTLDVFDNRALAAWGQGPTIDRFSANVGWDAWPGAGVFVQNAAPLDNCSGSSSNGSDGVYIWPILHADLDVDSILEPITHIVVCEDSPSGELLRSLVYHRSSGPGFTTFANCGVFIDSVATISAVVRQDPNSERVALVWAKPINPDEIAGNRYNNDVVYIESSDRGLSWGDEINVTNYQPDDSVRAYSNISAMYASDGCFHIVWDAPTYDAAKGLVSIMADRLYHWDDCNGCISTIVEADNYQGCLPGRGDFNATKENICECDGKLYVTYTYFAGDVECGTEDCSQGGFANGEIYAQVSMTGGLTWSEPLNLTNTPDDVCASGSCESEHWSSSAMYTTDSLYILYVGDTDAGGWAGTDEPEGEASLCPLMFMTYPCFEVAPLAVLRALPAVISYPFHLSPAAQKDTVIELVNSGNAAASYTADVSYITGTGWLDVSPGTGTVPAGCQNTDLIDMSVIAPLQEGLYRADLQISYEPGGGALSVPVELYCFYQFYLPEYATLRTATSRLAVQQTGRAAAQVTDSGFFWFKDSSDFLADASLIVGTGGEDMSLSIFHDLDDVPSPTNPWKRIYALSSLEYDSLSSDSYHSVSGYGCNHDSTVEFRTVCYAPLHSDTSNFYIIHFDVYPGPAFSETIDDLIVAFAADWEIPSDSGSDNRGGCDSALQLLFQQGQYAGSSDGNDNKFGGIAYRADDSALVWTAAGTVWENDRFVYPNAGYDVDTLTRYLRLIAGWTVLAPDSVEDLNCIIAVTGDQALGAGDTIAFSIILAGSNDGVLKSEVDLKETVAAAEAFICSHIAPKAPHCPRPSCFCGDADDNGTINISDPVCLIAYIFGGAPAPSPICLGDADGNNSVNVSDAVFLIAYIFGGGTEPHCFEERRAS
jgi:hypothetical protein